MPWETTRTDRTSVRRHLFDLATGNLLHTFNDPTITAGDEFGAGLAMDGNHVLIGAYRDDTNGANAGQVHLFDAATGALLNTFNSPNPMAFNFGRGVAIDGSFGVLGADFSGVNGQHPGLGQAYLFNITTGDLVQTFDDPTITDWDSFR